MTFVGYQAHGQKDQTRDHFNVSDQLAIQGYDPVAYFELGEAKKGKKDIRSTYEGIVYQFASSKHKALFDAQPEKYEPKYGGWCAYAMGADGSKVKIDPKTFKVLNGELYLFYNFYFNNTSKAGTRMK